MENSPPHLNAMMARAKKITRYHCARLGVKAEVYIVPRLHGNAIGQAHTGWAMFREGSKWKTYPPHFRLLRSDCEKHWDNPRRMDAVIVHELMHFKVPCGRRGSRRAVHTAAFRKAMLEYGYHPDVLDWDPKRRVPALE